MPEDNEQVAQSEPVAPPPAATPAPDTKENARLAAELAQTKQALGEVAEMVKSGKLRLAEDHQATAPAVEEDDSALIDRKEMKKREDVLRRQVAGALHQSTQMNSRLTRVSIKDGLRAKLKNFDKYEGEIDTILEKIADPIVASSPDTITQAYKVVRANHLEEEIEAEVAARAPAREEDDEHGYEAPSHIPGSMPSPTRSVAPAGDAVAGRQMASRRDQVTKPLTRDERIAASLFGITDAAEYRKYADRNYRPDLLGSKGRQKF